MRSSDHGLLRLLVLLTLCALGAACARAPDSETNPHPLRMVPDWGVNTESVPVAIEGEEFLVAATQHIGGPEPVTVDDRFEAFLDEVALEDVTWVDLRTLRARVPTGLAPGWHSLVVVGPMQERIELPRAYFSTALPVARLEAQARLEREQMWVDERMQLVLNVENTGGTAALAVTPVVDFKGEGKLDVLSAPQPADVLPGRSVSFVWELQAVRPGQLRITLGGGGREATSGSVLGIPEVELGPLRIRNRALITAALTPSLSEINVGQEVTVSLRVSNTGESTARGVVPDVPVVEGALARSVSGPEPVSEDIPPGESREFRWTYVSDSAGMLTFQAGAGGRDEHSGLEVRAPLVRSTKVIVRWPGFLVARFVTVPTSILVGQKFDLALEVTNEGDSTVMGVMIDGALAVGPVPVTRLSGPEPVSVDIPGKGKAVFRASLRAELEGWCAFQAGVRGKDRTSGAPVVASPVSTPAVTVRRRGVLP